MQYQIYSFWYISFQPIIKSFLVDFSTTCLPSGIKNEASGKILPLCNLRPCDTFKIFSKVIQNRNERVHSLCRFRNISDTLEQER